MTSPAASAPLCPFCDPDPDEIVVRHGPCLALWTHEPPEGSVMIVPEAHRGTPWDLTAREWASTQVLLTTVREQLLESHAPDGWTIGWNVGAVGGQSVAHVHCHLIPRYDDEPYAGRGLRWWLKRPENTLPTQKAGP